MFTGAAGEVKLMTLDPGHFHAALVQKRMYDQIDPEVFVYAPQGRDVLDHVGRIQSFNQREAHPTRWKTILYTQPDYLEQMLKEKPGNVVVLSGNNRQKTKYIAACTDAGLHVFADKPMCIDAEGFSLLAEVMRRAGPSGILVYDIMTERYEITTILQRLLSRDTGIFGSLLTGSPEAPAVIKESVHHFYKMVSGRPVNRPAWYFDTDQQGEGLVDVTTHLVDLIQWTCFPGIALDYRKDIHIDAGRHWTTPIPRELFSKVTGHSDFPESLQSRLDQQGKLPVLCNGEMQYRVRDVHARVTVTWNPEPPEGGGDTHYSMMRGSKSSLVIRQGQAQGFLPELYVEGVSPAHRAAVEACLQTWLAGLQDPYPGIGSKPCEEGWQIVIPDSFRIGHEAHFGQVMDAYLDFLVQGRLPAWEVPCMLAKYYTTTAALAMARQSDGHQNP